MAELSQFEKDGVTYDLKDAVSRDASNTNTRDIEDLKTVASTLPFKACTFVKKVDLAIDLGADWTAANVFITEDQDGNPLSLGPHFVIFTDYVTSISYGRICLKPTWDADRIPDTPTTMKGRPFMVSGTHDGNALIFNGTNTKLYIKGETTTYSSSVFGGLDFPVTGLILADTKTVSYVRIYEIVEE